MPGHTRQFEVSAGLVKLGWKVELFASDFNLTLRKYLKPKKLFLPVQLIIKKLLIILLICLPVNLNLFANEIKVNDFGIIAIMYHRFE